MIGIPHCPVCGRTHFVECPDSPYEMYGEDAGEVIARLRAEIESHIERAKDLIEQRDRLRADFDDCNMHRQLWKDKAEKLEIVNAKLLELLRASMADMVKIFDEI